MVEDAQPFLDVGGATASFQPLLDRVTVDVLHDEVRRSLVIAKGVDGQDVRVRNASHRAGLDAEQVAQVLMLEQLGPHELDGHVAIEEVVVSECHDAHAAGAEGAHDPIRVGDHGAALENELAHDWDLGARIGLGDVTATAG